MVEWNLMRAVDAMAGEVTGGDPKAVFRGAAIDSRRITGGELFFALPGSRVDGHAFVADALQRGAAGAVVDRPVEGTERGSVIRVADTYQALHALTRAVRRAVPERLVAITGSSGKTTTKELLASMLGRAFRTAKSPGNLNNLYGFPLALLGIPEDSQWMVAEMGMSTPGELRQISLLGRPDVALFTNVRPVHLESFPDLRGIADAKAELLAGLAPEGLVIANADDPWVMRIAQEHSGRVVRYGRGRDAQVRATEVGPAAGEQIGSRFVIEAGGERVTVTLRIHGLYNVENCLAAAACAFSLGVPLAEIAAAAATFSPAAGRGEVIRLAGPVTLIDDSYNSNPDAARKALESAAQLTASRTIAILGDMLELGPEAERFHREVGARAAELGFSLVVGVGPLARALVDGARGAKSDVAWFADASSAARWLTPAITAGDLVLVKGSRGIGLEVVVAALRQANAQQDEVAG